MLRKSKSRTKKACLNVDICFEKSKETNRYTQPRPVARASFDSLLAVLIAWHAHKKRNQNTHTKTHIECDRIQKITIQRRRSEMGQKEIVATNVVLNYPAVIGPKNYNGEKRYQTLIMIAKSDDVLLSEISDAIDDVIARESIQGGKFAKLDDDKKEQIALATLHDADAEKNEAMAGHYYVRVSSKTKPLVINQDSETLTAIDDIYAGVISSVVFRLYAYSFAPQDSQMKYGIKGELIGVVKMADGKRINNAISAESLLDKVTSKAKQTNNSIDADDDGYNNPFKNGDSHDG